MKHVFLIIFIFVTIGCQPRSHSQGEQRELETQSLPCGMRLVTMNDHVMVMRKMEDTEQPKKYTVYMVSNGERIPIRHIVECREDL